MRPLGALAREMLGMGVPMVHGLVTNEWNIPRKEESHADLLRSWDDATREIDDLWAQIPVDRFHETVTAFGQFTGPVHDLLLYVIDNEIHHRGQGYVYMRALGAEPPPFYDR